MRASIKPEVVDILPRLPKMTPERLIREAELDANQYFDGDIQDYVIELPKTLVTVLHILLDNL